jgi:hypothetical protein
MMPCAFWVQTLQMAPTASINFSRWACSQNERSTPAARNRPRKSNHMRMVKRKLVKRVLLNDR